MALAGGLTTGLPLRSLGCEDALAVAVLGSITAFNEAPLGFRSSGASLEVTVLV